MQLKIIAYILKTQTNNLKKQMDTIFPKVIRCCCTNIENNGGIYINPEKDSFINDDFCGYIRKDIHDEAVNYWQSMAEKLAKQVPLWHKYPEEKPKEPKEWYYVTFADKNIGEAFYEFANWYDVEDDCVTHLVTAWQELPEPYKEEKEKIK